MNEHPSRTRAHDVVESMHTQMRWARVAVIMLALITIPLFLLMTAADKGMENAKMLSVPFVLLSVALALGMFKLFRSAQGKLTAALDVVDNAEPQRMRARGLGLKDSSGNVLVAFWTQDRAGERLWSVAALRGSKRHPNFPRKDVEVTLYAAGSQPETALVVDVDGKIMWGTLIGREGVAATVRRANRTTWLLLFVFALGGAALNWFFWNQQQAARSELALAQASMAWPQTEGTIVSATMRAMRISQGKTSVPGCTAEVRYTYTAAGRTFQGERLYFGYQPTRDCTGLAALIEKYTPGATAEVHWNPENPAQSTLTRGDVNLSRKMAHDARLQSGVFTALWAVLLLVPLIMLVVTRSRWKAAQQLGLGREDG